MDLILITFILSFAINIAVFFPAYFFKTDKLTDISYALTFVLIAFYGFLNSTQNPVQILLLVMILVWATRLGTYLLYRIRKIGRDKRFDGMRERFTSFAGFWLLQGLTVPVVMLPATLLFNQLNPILGLGVILGFIVWIVGLGTEAISDWQKYRFINNPANRGRFIETGLWKYSRHPNYFGEVLLWFGVFIFAISSLILSETLIALIGPVYLFLLLYFISGVNLLEKSADRKYGNDPNWLAYKHKTSVFTPLPPKTTNQ